MKFANATKLHRKSGGRQCGPPSPSALDPVAPLLACWMGCIRIIGSYFTTTRKAPFSKMRPFAPRVPREDGALETAAPKVDVT
jgi:hypothetical protein